MAGLSDKIRTYSEMKVGLIERQRSLSAIEFKKINIRNLISGKADQEYTALIQRIQQGMIDSGILGDLLDLTQEYVDSVIPGSPAQEGSE